MNYILACIELQFTHCCGAMLNKSSNDKGNNDIVSWGEKETALNCAESAENMEKKKKKSSRFGNASLTSNLNCVLWTQMWTARNPMACLKFTT